VGASIPVIPDPRRVRMPGGVSVEGTDLTIQAQHAMAPLSPIFRLLDAFMAIVDVVKAVPQVIVNPGGVVEKIAILGPKVGALLGLLPPAAGPVLVADALDLVIDYLREVRDLLMALAGQEQRISVARARADELDDDALRTVCDDAQADVEVELLNMGKRMGAMSGMIGTINMVAGLVGLQAVPDLAGAVTGDVAQSAVEVDRLIAALQATRDAIPV